MKRKALALEVILSLLLSTVAGTWFANLGEADPLFEMEWKTPPIISIHSPANNNTFSANNVLLNFTVTKPTDWLIHGNEYSSGAQQILRSVSYQLDEKYYDPIPANSTLESPFDYSVNLTNLRDGVHSLKVYAYASGWVKVYAYASGWVPLWEYEVPINSSSDVVYFTVITISLLSPENKTYGTSNIPLNFTISEPVSQITYSLDGHGNVTVSGNITLRRLPNGEHNITVYAKDEAGNTGASETIYFRVEVPFPTATVVPIATIAVLVIAVGLLFYFKKRKR
jgi:hypothetical protein